MSHAFAGQAVGIKEVAEKIWLVTFTHYDLGFFDQETIRVECAQNPFEAHRWCMNQAQRMHTHAHESSADPHERDFKALNV